MSFDIYESPIGPLTLTGDAVGLTGLWFPGRGDAHDESERDPAPFTEVIAQLDAYFTGELTTFAVPLAPHGQRLSASGLGLP